jgi:hypothetical protein
VPTPFAFDRTWDFAVAPEDLWATLARTDRYREWWPWIRELYVDGDGLHEGTVADFVIQAPLPYQLRCTLAVEHARESMLLAGHVTGDLEGPARLELRPSGTGTSARLAWALEVQSGLLRPFAAVARPALAWAHDRIVERGLVQFEQYALAEPSRD